MKVPERTVILLSGYRTGSNFVASIFSKNRIGDPKEQFQLEQRRQLAELPEDEQIAHIRNKISDSIIDGTYAVKLPVGDFCDITQRLGFNPLDLPRESEVFGQLELVRVLRNDRFAQAISMWRARMTGEWVRRHGDVPAETPEFDFAKIKDAYDFLSSQEFLFEEVFGRNKNLARHRLPYEKFSTDPNTILDVIRKLFGGYFADRELLLESDHEKTRDELAIKFRNQFVRQMTRRLIAQSKKVA